MTNNADKTDKQEEASLLAAVFDNPPALNEINYASKFYLILNPPSYFHYIRATKNKNYAQ